MIVTKDRREIELMAEAGRIVALVHEKLKRPDPHMRRMLSMQDRQKNCM